MPRPLVDERDVSGAIHRDAVVHGVPSRDGRRHAGAVVGKSKGRLLYERASIMLLGVAIGIPLALGASWITDGDVAFWQAMVPVVITLVIVPVWTRWGNRKAARQ